MLCIPITNYYVAYQVISLPGNHVTLAGAQTHLRLNRLEEIHNTSVRMYRTSVKMTHCDFRCNRHDNGIQRVLVVCFLC